MYIYTFIYKYFSFQWLNGPSIKGARWHAHRSVHLKENPRRPHLYYELDKASYNTFERNFNQNSNYVTIMTFSGVHFQSNS